jgi:hypothetical protein
MTIFRIDDLMPEDRMEFFQRFQRFMEISQAINDDFELNAIEAKLPMMEQPSEMTFDQVAAHWKNLASGYERQVSRHQDAADQLNAIGEIVERNRK